MIHILKKLLNFRRQATYLICFWYHNATKTIQGIKLFCISNRGCYVSASWLLVYGNNGLYAKYKLISI